MCVENSLQETLYVVSWGVAALGLSAIPSPLFFTPRPVPSRGPSVTWDIFFHLEEGPAFLRPCRVSDAGQPWRGAPCFCVLLPSPPSLPLAPLDLL